MNWNRPCSTLWRRLRLQKVKMRNDAIDVKVNEGLLAFFAEEKGVVGFLVGLGIGIMGILAKKCNFICCSATFLLRTRSNRC